jgi:hypothetical protein
MAAAAALDTPHDAVQQRRLSRADASFIGLHLITAAAGALQALIDPSYDNLICILLVLCSSSLTFLYVRGTRALHEWPLSTAAVLGLCATTQWGALMGQTVLWNSLTENLRVPLQTFGYLLGFQLTAIAAHGVSRSFSVFVAARRLGAAAVAPLGAFSVPAVQVVWIVGLVGLASAMGGRLLGGNLLGKVLDGFATFAWAPFVLPLLYERYGSAYCHLRRHIPFLALHVVLAVLAGLAFNARSIMVVGAMTGLLLYLMHLLDDERPFEFTRLWKLALAVLAVALLFQPVSYFMTAVQVARAERGKISQIEMVKHTWQVLQDPVAVRREADRGLIAADVGPYDEIYFRSGMIGRLVETKFHDNSFFMVDGVSATESRLVREDAFDRMVAILPYPVLKWMGLERSKFVTFYSAGDLLVHLRLGLDLGSFVTGSIFAQLLACFGVWSPLIYFVLCVAMFIAWDLLSRPGRSGAAPVVSVVAMMLMYRVFSYGIVSESISNIAGLLLRFQVQNILLFGLLLAVTRVFWRPFNADGPAADLRGRA